MIEHICKTSNILAGHFDEQNKIGSLNANFSKHFGLKKIAAHYFKIPSGYRTSKPHAESLEEEFVYVISGKVDLWFNGKIKQMNRGDCIGFPAGTGIGHTFINNYDGDLELFVSGDRTKIGNQYSFHLGPELSAECGDNWWSGMPAQDLGGHDGLPGDFDSLLIDNDIFTLNAFENISDGSYSYPGDKETFTNGACLSRRFGMKNIAVWLERIPIGKRSSWPHAHSVEEEFVYNLEGSPVVCLNEKEIEVAPETAIDFKAGSAIAHTLINRTKDDVYYLCVGECKPKNDKIYYPDHPTRNEEMRKKGIFWTELKRDFL